VSKGVSRTGVLAATRQIRMRSTGCLAHSDGRLSWVTSAARAQIDFAQAIASVIDRITGKLLVSAPSQRAVRPRIDAPTTVWAVLVAAVIGINTIGTKTVSR
jgi:hypothetical protein